jgi:hypothetical protein
VRQGESRAGIFRFDACRVQFIKRFRRRDPSTVRMWLQHHAHVKTVVGFILKRVNHIRVGEDIDLQPDRPLRSVNSIRNHPLTVVRLDKNLHAIDARTGRAIALTRGAAAAAPRSTNADDAACQREAEREQRQVVQESPRALPLDVVTIHMQYSSLYQNNARLCPNGKAGHRCHRRTLAGLRL